LAYGDRRTGLRRLALAGLMVVAAAPAFSQSGNFELELNTAADVAGACRLTFVATNGTSVALTQTSYNVAIFDAKGAASSILILEFGDLPLNKTRVVQFDLPDRPCADVSRILVNDQDACTSAEGDSNVCLASLSASSRIPTIPFGQ